MSNNTKIDSSLEYLNQLIDDNFLNYIHDGEPLEEVDEDISSNQQNYLWPNEQIQHKSTLQKEQSNILTLPKIQSRKLNSPIELTPFTYLPFTPTPHISPTQTYPFHYNNNSNNYSVSEGCDENKISQTKIKNKDLKSCNLLDPKHINNLNNNNNNITFLNINKNNLKTQDITSLFKHTNSMSSDHTYCSKVTDLKENKYSENNLLSDKIILFRNV